MVNKLLLYFSIHSLFHTIISYELHQLFCTISGATLDYLPEIVEKLFHRLEELLIAASIPAEVIRGAIDKITAQTKLEPFFEIFDLLDKTRVSEEVEQRFRKDIATLKNKATHELLARIKVVLVSKKTTFDRRNSSAVDAEIDTVNRMRAVFEQMLVVSGIPQENAKKAVDDLEPDVLNETLAKLKLVDNSLQAIQNHSQPDLLIKFDIEGKQKKSITSVIIGTLKNREYRL